MALSDLPDTYLADFGVDCVAGSITGKGILDMPTEVLAGDMVLSVDYQLTARADQFGDLEYGSEISVNGVAYTVRDSRLIDDGIMCQLSLQRSVATSLTVSDTPIDGNGADVSIDDLGIAQLDPEIDGGSAGTSYLEGNVIDGGAA